MHIYYLQIYFSHMPQTGNWDLSFTGSLRKFRIIVLCLAHVQPWIEESLNTGTE